MEMFQNKIYKYSIALAHTLRLRRQDSITHLVFVFTDKVGRLGLDILNDCRPHKFRNFHRESHPLIVSHQIPNFLLLFLDRHALQRSISLRHGIFSFSGGLVQSCRRCISTAA